MNVIERLNQEREQRVQGLHLDLPIPTWNGGVIARFTVMGRSEMEKFAKKGRTSEADLDFIIAACDSIWVHDPDHELEGERMAEDNGSPYGEDYVRLEHAGGVPIGFEQALGEQFQFNEDICKRARLVALHMFGNNTIAVGSQVVRLVQWMSNTDSKIAQDQLGE